MPAVVQASGVSRLATVIALLGAALGGCASGQALQVKKVAASVQPPANVALYLKVTRPDGQPATLLATDFKVYEDGKMIPIKKVKRALLSSNMAVDRYVMIAVDLSGPLVDSEYLSTLQDTLGQLAERLGKGGHVALAAFDGDGLKTFVNYEDTDSKSGLAELRKFRPKNRNVDLWGTFVETLAGLDEAAGHSTAAARQSALILMTDRRDKAGRHSRDEALGRVQASPSDVYVVGIGDAVGKEELEPLGKSGAFFIDEPHDLEKPFSEAASKIEAQRAEDFIFEYCSMVKVGKRPAKHKVELRIATPKFHGEIEHEFSTRGFVKGACDPKKKPDFAAKPDAADAADAGAGEADDEGGDGEDKPAKGKKGHAKKKPKPADDEGGDADGAGQEE